VQQNAQRVNNVQIEQQPNPNLKPLPQMLDERRQQWEQDWQQQPQQPQSIMRTPSPIVGYR
jgi:hypothetical protein